MKPESKESFLKLEKSIDELIKVYRHLLGVVRKEKEILVSAQLGELSENNKTKEAMLIRARELEENRVSAAKELARSEGISENTRLLEFAKHIRGEDGERLRSLHSVLDLLLKRVREHNTQNETLVSSALNNITGAIGSIRDLIKDKPTYAKSGSKNARPAEAGQLVRKEI
jgi:hypothetical protein